MNVYGVPMSRTNVDIDEELIARAMERFGLRTKREAVDLALRRLVGPMATKEDVLAMRGMGWAGDLEQLRQDRVEDLWGQ